MRNNKKDFATTIKIKKAPIVVADFGDKNIIRIKSTPTENSPTPRQLIQRKKFALVLELLKPVMPLLNTYFGFPEGARSRYDAAKSYCLRNVIEVSESTTKLHYNKIIFAKGFLLNVSNLKCRKGSGSSLFLTWEDNTAQGENKPSDDLMVIILQEETNEYQLFLKVAKRNDTEIALNLAPQFIGSEVNVYAFMAAEDENNNSTSQYLGTFMV